MKKEKSALSEFEYRVIDLLTKRPRSATTLAGNLWHSRMPSVTCKFAPAQLATSQLNRLHRRGLVIKKGIDWYATERAILLFCTEYLERFT